MFGFSLIKKLLWGSCKKKVNQDEQSINVVDSIVKAHNLYKRLVIKVHPDRHPNNREVAEELMKLLTSNKHNYSQLKKIEDLINEKL